MHAFHQVDSPSDCARTDQATTQLLQHLITEKQAMKKAVTETMKEVGPDPVAESILLYYPNTLVDNYVIPSITGNFVLNDTLVLGCDS